MGPVKLGYWDMGLLKLGYLGYWDPLLDTPKTVMVFHSYFKPKEIRFD